MKVVLIGNSGTGKSTLARQIHATTGWPLLALDRLWHATDYSEAAKIRFQAAQTTFMATHVDWVIDGNYTGTLPARIAQADFIIWLRAPRVVAMARVLRRSLAFRRDPRTRPDMAPGFEEHLDREYLAFLAYVWGYGARAKATLLPLLAAVPPAKLRIVQTPMQKAAILGELTAKNPLR